MKPKDILILGVWHQGAVASAVWSDLGFEVTALVTDEVIARDFSRGQTLVEERGLCELIVECVKKSSLTFTSYLPEKSYDLVALMHDTPVDSDDIVQLDHFWSDIERAIPILNKDTVIFISAQVPLGTCDEISKRIQNAKGFEPQVMYMPENLILGDAIERFRFPRLPVVGSSDSVSTKELMASLFPNSEFKFIGIREAELLKHTLNSFLALCITFANEISSMMSKSTIDVAQVMEALRFDDRIGESLPIRPGLPFSGGTLARDVQNLRRISSSSILADAIWDSNQARKKFFLELIIDKYRELGSSKPIGIIGLTYKLGTNTIRRSFSVESIQWLKSNKVESLAYDTNTKFAEKLPKEVNLSNNLESVMKSCDLLVVFNLSHESTAVLNMLESRHFIIDPNGVLQRTNKRESGKSI